MQLKFNGAIENVTGSKHLIITQQGKQVLLDCGLYQGVGKQTEVLNRTFDFDPARIEAVILSHAHIDHSGNLPNLVKQGFKGKIYCTPATYDVCEVLLTDSAHIQESDIRFINKRRRKNNQPLLKPIYTAEDVEKCLRHFKKIPFHSECRVNDELSFHFTDAGHIIGAAAVHLTSLEKGKTTKLTFTGDVGRYSDLLLKAPEAFKQSDYLICESTYGDRLHEKAEDSENKLLNVIRETCVANKGKLIIPAFSLGRTQELVFVLDKLKNKGLLPAIKIFVDSPLSFKATEIVEKHTSCFNSELIKYVKEYPDPFRFPGLTYIQDKEESIALNELTEPCVIISASGMADAGRVKHHIRQTISDPKNTILITGYCAPGTLGSDLLHGKNKVHIYGDFFEVKARIESILSYSAHADYKELIKFLSCQDKQEVKNIFLVHGEETAKSSFKEKLLAEGYPHVTIPLKGEKFNLD